MLLCNGCVFNLVPRVLSYAPYGLERHLGTRLLCIYARLRYFTLYAKSVRGCHCFQLHWNPLKYGHQWAKKKWPYYRGRLKFHDMKAVMTNTPYIALSFLEQPFSLINNRSEDIAYSNRKDYLKFSFSK